MAKGDMNGQQQAPQAPKIDQYSVMHKLMDQMGGSMAPSQNFQAPGQMPNQMPQMPQFGNRPMPHSGPTDYENNPAGVNPQLMQPSYGIAPSDPQTMIRRQMMGQR